MRLVSSQVRSTGSVAPPLSPLLDDFNRPNENPLWQWGNWADTGIGGGNPLPLSGNVAGPGNSDTAYRVEQLPGDMEAWATLSGAPDPLGNMRIYVCLNDVGTAGWDGYALQINRGFSDIFYSVKKITNGSASDLWSAQLNFSGVGERLLLRRSGTGLEARRLPAGSSTWESLFQTTDTSFTGGRLGIQAHAGGGAFFGFDEFGGTG